MHKKDCIAWGKGLSTDTAQDFPPSLKAPRLFVCVKMALIISFVVRKMALIRERC